MSSSQESSDKKASRPKDVSHKRQKVDEKGPSKKKDDSDGEADYGDQEGEDSFDEDFDEENGEDEIADGEEEELDIEDYLKWRQQHGDAPPEGEGEDSKASDFDAEEGEDEDAYDDEDDEAKWPAYHSANLTNGV